MANIKSAQKRIRITERRTAINRMRRSQVRTAVRQSRESLATGNVDDAIAATRAAVSSLDVAANKGLVHPNNAARRKSRLMKKLAVLVGQES